MTNSNIRLTQFAHGSGCGCKISPAVLQEILGDKTHDHQFPALLVGNDTKDDAAVMALDEKTCLISTADFFTPVVDDAFDFGRIAAANAIGDVYAMGGKPLMAIALLGWPVDILPAKLASEVLRGARQVCEEIGIPLAGGHSIDTREPIFGLSVNGLVQRANIKRNATAEAGDVLFLTRPLGTGILAAALKRGLLSEEEKTYLTHHMSTINKAGMVLAEQPAVTAMTDVTGFGIAGHLLEMCQAANLTAEISMKQVPILPAAVKFIEQGVMPDATFKNWNTYTPHMKLEEGVDVTNAFTVLPDPQTNGGLLFSCKPEGVAAVLAALRAAGYTEPAPIGQLLPPIGTSIRVLP
jgi:selenide,water dikinase